MTKPVQIINDYWLKEVILNGNPSLDKFYKEDLIRAINILKQENKKYKEVIEKVIDYINDVSRHTDNYFDLDNNLWIREVELLDILKEVEHEKSNN